MRTHRLDAATSATCAALSFNLDANETAVFARELEALRTEIVEYEFPELKIRSLIPLEPGVDPGAETLTWYEFTDTGLAKMLVNYADDLETVEALGTKQTSNIEAHGIAYMYSAQDLRAWRKTGRPLDRRKAEAARKAVERRVEKIGALGDTPRNVPGFLKNANVPFITTGLTALWNTTATPMQTLTDLTTIAMTVWAQSKQVHTPNTMIVGSATYRRLSRPFDVQSPKSILKTFLESQDMIKEIVPWVQADLADSGNDGERLVCYEKNPSNMALVIPLDFEQHPPQAENLMFKIPCEGRIGGAVVYKPLSMVYVDNLLDP